MRANAVRELWRQGKPAVGCLLTLHLCGIELSGGSGDRKNSLDGILGHEALCLRVSVWLTSGLHGGVSGESEDTHHAEAQCACGGHTGQSSHLGLCGGGACRDGRYISSGSLRLTGGLNHVSICLTFACMDTQSPLFGTKTSTSLTQDHEIVTPL